ncbi:MAG: DUF2064 domain-containing protein [Candidatus Synoicihabitans palmerolidicus]|nr:DUF2064 domain-containing protein [Candidatus Synoicihabitans palmerolidicus]
MIPTVLIFLKVPEAGRVKTRLAADLGGGGGGADLSLAGGAPVGRDSGRVAYAPAEARQVMRVWLGEATGRTYWAQSEGGLGVRLDAAMSGAFARGAKAVMLIGGDCAELAGSRFREAADRLEEYYGVMGPAADGGYYLLGMKRAQPAWLRGITWSTAVGGGADEGASGVARRTTGGARCIA